MPTYRYRCPKCGSERKWKSRWRPECSKCGVVMERVYNRPGFILKDGGFYSTENRD